MPRRSPIWSPEQGRSPYSFCARARLRTCRVGKLPRVLITRPFKLRDARARVREAATRVGLAADLTLAACRHGGLTELGNAELTEQCVTALSGHKTPQAARLYVKWT